MHTFDTLPIDELLPGVVEALKSGGSVAIEAAPGAGKTTRVPVTCLQFGRVIVLEPRRIAARLAAQRVAAERGERVGETVGYQVRFEEVAGPGTRLLFVTEGVLTRRLLRDPDLRGIQTVVLDEFHERHLEGDLALALLRRLQRTKRRDLRLVVMSATLNARRVAEFLGDCPILRSEGRLHAVAVRYAGSGSGTMEEQVARAAEACMQDGSRGDVLAFLPGAAEIRRAARLLRASAGGSFRVAELFGELSAAEQDDALRPGPGRKVVLSTNLAESSVTIEGVDAVVDSGLARVASDSPWTGLPVLRVARVSQASAVQRAGRAGRMGPGRVVRLYSGEDFVRRKAEEEPEILRRELSGLCLQLRAMGLGTDDLEWLDEPPAAAVAQAEELLRSLGATSDAEVKRLASLPVHPRVARLLLEATRRGVQDEGVKLAALLSSGERAGSSELHEALEMPLGNRGEAVAKQLRRVLGAVRGADTGMLEACALAAFPDRVGQQRSDSVVMLANGTAAESKGTPGAFLVALDAEERAENALPTVRLRCAIEPEWLIDQMADRVTERDRVEWNRRAERVEQVSGMYYGELVLSENRQGQPDAAGAAELLVDEMLARGLEAFLPAEELTEMRDRVRFASQWGEVRDIDDEAIRDALRRLAYGSRSFAEARKFAAELPAELERATGREALEQMAPARLRLARGRTVRVRYREGQSPWVESRLQDFFGMRETPKVAGGRVPLVVHLLAPNQRPVQTTTDLAGFWERLYPQVRRELCRRYPRHSWPEDPRTE